MQLTGRLLSNHIEMHPPRPHVTPLTQFFWDGLAERRLMILRCAGCGHHVHLPRPVCDRCGGDDLVPTQMSGGGTLYAYTVTVQAFHPYYADKVPYTLAVVELDEQPGLRITTQIAGCPEARLRVGLPVRLVWTEVARDMTLPYFTPVDLTPVDLTPVGLTPVA